MKYSICRDSDEWAVKDNSGILAWFKHRHHAEQYIAALRHDDERY